MQINLLKSTKRSIWYLGLSALLLLMAAVLLSVQLRSEMLAAHPDWGECFHGHLLEASHINAERQGLYASLSEGRTAALSERLIASERQAMWVAYPLELVAAWLWRNDIPILCHDYVSMSAIKPQQTELIPVAERPQGNLQLLTSNDLKAKLRAAKDKDDYNGVYEVAHAEVVNLNGEPLMGCMTRHVLESLARVAWLTPYYGELAKQRSGIAQLMTHSLSRISFELHLAGLELAHGMDQDAASLARDGVAILCHDVPPIEMSPSFRDKRL